MLDTKSLAVLSQALEKLDSGFGNLPEFKARSFDLEQFAQVLNSTAEKLQNNFPYFHPLYAGQMLKPPHPIARLAYALAMYVNPNNHALDGGRATSALEKEAVAGIAAMFGWREFIGHLCGGGTMANLEALWVAGQIHPGKKILANEQAHYTHKRISGVLQLGFESVHCDVRGRMDLAALEGRVKKGDVGTVVATLGTTATGSTDPLVEILELSKRFGFRVHVDTAYGGYFKLVTNLAEPARKAFEKIGEADSIVIDPHKHGLQPYGCGCVLFRDPGVGKLYKHESASIRLQTVLVRINHDGISFPDLFEGLSRRLCEIRHELEISTVRRIHMNAEPESFAQLKNLHEWISRPRSSCSKRCHHCSNVALLYAAL